MSKIATTRIPIRMANPSIHFEPEASCRGNISLHHPLATHPSCTTRSVRAVTIHRASRTRRVQRRAPRSTTQSPPRSSAATRASAWTTQQGSNGASAVRSERVHRRHHRPTHLDCTDTAEHRNCARLILMRMAHSAMSSSRSSARVRTDWHCDSSKIPRQGRSRFDLPRCKLSRRAGRPLRRSRHHGSVSTP